LALAKVVVLPSLYRTEAFGIALLEGAMFGKPLIATELGTGTSFICLNDYNGLVVPPGDPIALANAISRIFTESGLSERLGKASFEYYKNEFSLDKMVRSYIELYENVLGN
jgi:rhamnosyl/mannosyltransferase